MSEVVKPPKKTYYKYVKIGSFDMDSIFSFKNRDICNKDRTKPSEYLTDNSYFIKTYNILYDEIVLRFINNYKQYNFKHEYDSINYKIIYCNTYDYYDGSYEGSNIDVYAELIRQETDEEYDTRIEREEKNRINNAKNKLQAKKNKDQKDLEELKRLADKLNIKLPENIT